MLRAGTRSPGRLLRRRCGARPGVFAVGRPLLRPLSVLPAEKRRLLLHVRLGRRLSLSAFRPSLAIWRATAPISRPSSRRRSIFPSTFPVGSVVIDHRGRQLFLVTSSPGGVALPDLGRHAKGFSWAGTETISRVANWPDWHPPEEMRDRDPNLPEKMTGGVQEPARRQGPLSRQLALPHPRHQRCQVDRPGGFVGMLPHAQRPRRRSVQPRESRDGRNGRAQPPARA